MLLFKEKMKLINIWQWLFTELLIIRRENLTKLDTEFHCCVQIKIVVRDIKQWLTIFGNREEKA